MLVKGVVVCKVDVVLITAGSTLLHSKIVVGCANVLLDTKVDDPV